MSKIRHRKNPSCEGVRGDLLTDLMVSMQVLLIKSYFVNTFYIYVNTKVLFLFKPLHNELGS